eukprot:TRINITY_DN3358_c0_g2_i6.p1 TRINITY_DN3358_c0_g2~~TRINITY_DN3358_c0_g2_i6.p1  ORF type:complete len:483 (+),score=121.45 TRINITY_DN3358_c0_g2_i6:336-1784(+)
MNSLKISNVTCKGATGQFRSNAESIGWKSTEGDGLVVHPASSLKRAEWCEGKLRLLCEAEDGSSQVMALDGFSSKDYDALWRYFEQTCGVYLKKHRPMAQVSEEDFDTAMRGIEGAADKVDDATAMSVQKKAREADLMKKVEMVRDGLDQAVSGDKQALCRVFAANGCERIGRLRLVIDTVQLEVYHTDPRWKHLRSKCKTIEEVLKDLGSFRQWKPPEDEAHSSMLRRAMVRELRIRQGEDIDDSDEEEVKPKTGKVEVPENLKSNVGLGPLGGYAADAKASPMSYTGQAVPLAPSPEELAEQEELAAARKKEQDEIAEAERRRKEREEAEAAAAKAAAEQGSDDDVEDIEVSDPNSVRANPHADKEHDHSRMRYTHPGSILEGWVWKRSRFLKRWRRRWLVLMPNKLMTFATRPVGGKMLPTEQVDAGSVLNIYSADGEVLQARAFGVVTRKRTYYMVCDDEVQKRNWMKEIASSLQSNR